MFDAVHAHVTDIRTYATEVRTSRVLFRDLRISGRSTASIRRWRILPTARPCR